MKKKIVINTVQTLTLKEVFEIFIKHKQAMNTSSATIKSYTACYRKFTRFYDENKISSAICEDDIINYILYIREDNPDIAEESINTYLRNIRAVLYFAMDREYIPRFKIKLTKAEKAMKETYTDAELEKLLKKPVIKDGDFSEYRNWVIINYLLGTGNRSRTLRGLRIGDIDFDAHEIVLNIVKNRRAYTIPLSHTLERVLIEYLQYRNGTPDDYLFCTQYGEQITADGLTSIIGKYNISRGVSKTSIHLFRHTFAKKWILNKGDIFRLQKILGHKTLDMVKEYVNMFGQDLRQDFDTFNPLDNLSFIKEKKKIHLDK